MGKLQEEPDEDTVSLRDRHTGYEHDDGAPLPPSYNESEALAAASSSHRSDTDANASESLLPADPYVSVPSTSKSNHISSDRVQLQSETTVRMDARLNEPEELQEYIESYIAAIPPNQLVRINGTHQGTFYNASSKKNEIKLVTDFDITFSLQSYLRRNEQFYSALTAANTDRVHRGGFLATRAQDQVQDIELAENNTPTLQDWCQIFCNDASALKVFRINREISGLDTEYIRTSIDQIVRSVHYYGRLHTTFPPGEKRIDIYSPHWANRLRLSGWKWFFYLTFLWVITWPLLFFLTKVWAVYSVTWYWSRRPEGVGAQGGLFKYASVSEREWIEKHRNLVRSLVLEKFKGDAMAFPTDVPDEFVERGIEARRPREPEAWGGNT